MTDETFKKASFLLDEIQRLKSLIGDKNDRSAYMDSKFIQTAAEDDNIKSIIRAKVDDLQKQFDSL